MKPKLNQTQKDYQAVGLDDCQTPPYALSPLYPYLHNRMIVWECAAGIGSLSNALMGQGFTVNATDIKTGCDFFEYKPEYWDILITNPPYSRKYEWLARCYELGKPFALLMPVEMIGAKKAQVLFKKYGFEWIFLDKRVNFYMPHMGHDGHGAQFPVAWFCWRLTGEPVTFAEITR